MLKFLITIVAIINLNHHHSVDAYLSDYKFNRMNNGHKTIQTYQYPRLYDTVDQRDIMYTLQVIENVHRMFNPTFNRRFLNRYSGLTDEPNLYHKAAGTDSDSFIAVRPIPMPSYTTLGDSESSRYDTQFTFKPTKRTTKDNEMMNTVGDTNIDYLTSRDVFNGSKCPKNTVRVGFMCVHEQ